ncbi:hypothetical protein SNEBB_011147 [Seison nebaliae]|nr:hypothetical protein SNEBB_011147 [Seison nebaliae]
MHLSDEIHEKLQSELKNISQFSICLDDSLTIDDKPLLLVFCRYVLNFEIIEQLLLVATFNDRTCGVDIANKLKEFIDLYSIRSDKIMAITTDGAPSMIGRVNGCVAILKNANVLNNDIPYIHCYLHRLNLSAKSA